MSSSLNGVLVVSLEQAVAAPYCSCKLADAGARVIKLEREEGDFARDYDHLVAGESAYFVWLNRGKESIRVDIKADSDRALIKNMLSEADVFIQNLAPGAAQRAGLGSTALRREFPQLVTCDISGYGSHGPYREMRAYDLLVQGETGLISITGNAGTPGRVGISLCDTNCGLQAYAGILEALIARQTTGRGSGVEVSLFDSLADWMNVPYLQTRYGRQTPSPIGISHPTIAPYGLYHSNDGRALIISIQNEREWRRFASEVLQRADLVNHTLYQNNSLRVRHRTTLDAIITEQLAALDHETLVGRLAQCKIAYGHLNSVAEFAAHPQLNFQTVWVGNEAIDVIATGIHHQHTEPTESMPQVPRLGQHDNALRREFASATTPSRETD